MTPEIALRPLTARSVVLSVLLGTHPPELPARDLVRVATLFDISDTALRVALTRMVAAGDLTRVDATYRLSERLVARQRRQDDAVEPSTTDWDGTWEVLAVTATGRGAADRAALRARLAALRLAELREGVWVRPANLRRARTDDLDGVVQRFRARPETDHGYLARGLWDLDGWSAHATALLGAFEAADRARDRFTVAAAAVRHLLADPVLPAALLPRSWPAAGLRAAYHRYRAEFADLTRVTRHG
ncbi:PaaX family transcriptional regulator C-terminal domain-containing protein [Saccharothrix australiensis]|uniref:PaaX family transcriptional regulator n=1 Tax=Saccharothrix australiensis TaxID=2072 RepID=A0A495VZP0_9PSEU|nr:PaaX family transcriptional regulator C-terminal domain-containing protein [Saccharothrix australiensis]RKT54826.1 PaaX family transcriptional regulator [Saccharothrix australiensis]